jgi:hypothetical protein
MNFNFTGLLSGLRKGLDAVETLMPIATAMGAPTGLITTVTNIAQAVLETGQNVSERVTEGKIVATSEDQDEKGSFATTLYQST